ncbi:MAG: DUF131 domain-containing protein [Candidatus Aenigmatarchaeota archaeon]
MMELQNIPVGAFIFFLGIGLVLLGSVLLLLESKQTKIEGGAIIWIGPFPIALATSKEAFYFLLITSLIFILVVVLFFFIRG